MFAISEQSGARLGLRTAVRRAIAHLSWRVGGIALAIVIALDVWSMLAVWSLFDLEAMADEWRFLSEAYVSALVMNLLFVLSMIFPTLVADELVATGARRLPTYAVAVVIGCSVGALAQWQVLDWLNLRWYPLGTGMAHEALVMQPASVFLENLIWGSIIVFIYVNRRGALHAAARLSSAQVIRTTTQRRMIEARLQALQARVEPQFLFGSLAQVRDLYETDPAKGRQVLGELIAYLRAALPHLRELVSTLRRELELVSVYVNVLRARPGRQLDLAVDVPDGANVARMPAMALLPLVNCVLSCESAPLDHPETLRITARKAGSKLRLEIMYRGSCFASGRKRDDLQDIEQRLHALYGDAWKLEFEPSVSHGTHAVMEIPYEATDGSYC